jgi:very-short-patch-repair endonuclease
MKGKARDNKITRSPLSRGRSDGGKGKRGLPLHAGAEPHQFKYARELRREMTKAEKVLWDSLRARRFMNLKFRRQHPILEFIADFYCHQLKLIVEADGKYHEEDDAAYYDSERTKELQQYSFTVVRFSNKEILGDLENVLRQLTKVVAKLRNTSPQTSLHLERSLHKQGPDSKIISQNNPKSTPSPRGEGRGEVKKKGNQP